MPIDVNQFLPTFIEESKEMLEEAEQILLHLDLQSVNVEDINRIFRIMHSIKGNSAVFNFVAMNELTHVLETFLNDLRSDPQHISENEVDMIFKGVDCLRGMVNDISHKTPMNETKAQELKKLIQNKPKQEIQEVKQVKHNAPVKEIAPTLSGLKIEFLPDQNLFQLGNDPTRVFHLLSDLGKLKVEADVSQIPSLNEIDPQACFLRWKIEILGDIKKEQVTEYFSWIADIKNLKIKAISVPQKQINLVSKPHELDQTVSVRVTTEKIDSLINMVGELVISQSILGQILKDVHLDTYAQVGDAMQQLEDNSRELQAGIMRIRMVPIEFVFNRFPRMVHDLSKQLGKKIKLIMSGEQTELDKNMIEKLTHPLMHIIRNSIDHGIETPDVRLKKGKVETGTIELKAYQDGGNIVIKIVDDGAGLNKDEILKKAIKLGLTTENEIISTDHIYEFIFQPGFSTSKEVSEISGRGVGLDVVAKNINEIKGEIDITTIPDKGTTFTLRIPLTLAIIDCQLVKINNQTYILPLANIKEIISIDQAQVKEVDERHLVYDFRGNYIPIVDLQKILYKNTASVALENRFLIIFEIDNQLIGLVVDELSSQQRIVIKSLEDNYKKIQGISGVSILGNGQIALIVDVTAIINIALNPQKVMERMHLEKKDKSENKNSETPTRENEERCFEFLTFSLGGKEFGVDLSLVREIRMLESITFFPNTPSYLLGAINVRGIIIPILDLSECLSLKAYQRNYQNVIITLNLDQNNQHRCVGTVVDQVLDTYMLKYKDVLPIPDKMQTHLKHYLAGFVKVDGKMIMLLKPQNLMEMVTE